MTHAPAKGNTLCGKVLHFTLPKVTFYGAKCYLSQSGLYGIVFPYAVRYCVGVCPVHRLKKRTKC